MPTISYALAPSKTCAERIIYWTKVPSESLMLMGMVHIREAKFPGRKPKERTYAITFIDSGEGEWRVRFKKKDEDEHYVCLRAAGHDECVCIGYTKNGSCVHTEILRHLAAEGQLAPQIPVLPPRLAQPPRDGL